MLPLARPQPPSPVVSSSSTLWATASKEWVIPAKPKPGRKPKKDTAPPAAEEADATDSKGRRVQNRAAQRAFRERKQSQLAELQARIQMYEQGEIERNVALQSVAKRLKDENEKLREENIALKEKVANLERKRDARKESDLKRWRDNTVGFADYSEHPLQKRAKLAIDTDGPPAVPMSFIPSPPSMVSSPSSGDTSDAFSPMPLSSPPEEPMAYAPHMSPLNDMFDFQQNVKQTSFDAATSMDTFDCGFCNDNTPCVCREIAMQQSIGRLDMPTQPAFKVKADDNVVDIIDDQAVPSLQPESAPQARISILENLPAYQPAVPLRRRPTTTTVKSLFPVSLPSAQDKSKAMCSGDPSNCMACADDAFGKAFCEAVGESVASDTCADCPSRQTAAGECAGPSSGGCCGTKGACRKVGSCCGPSVSVPLPPIQESSHPDTMPTSDAWRQLKSHPNVAFSDLSLLAEVVARRSKCTGPRVVISPAPGSITPERSTTPNDAGPSQPPAAVSTADAVLLTDPHAHYHQKQQERASPPMLVPQEELIRCGRPRLIREVRTDAVQEALRLLDAKFA
ncbi:hypothetical protein EWM64_g3530 [Hericium alpestre]|uniref:BZIP domain-containing protein n=1 Tax=Hericium alpestre TaxID=135208 RepID=A0A4Z0A089_9AGAM|nr:hypothetical protein EWM64_g3530 [Hericium alpestre]